MVHPKPSSTQPASPIESSFSICGTISPDPRLSVMTSVTATFDSHLIDAYPSITKPLHRLQELKISNDISKLGPRSKRFTTSLLDFISNSLPQSLASSHTLHSEYRMGRSSLVYCVEQFSKCVAKPLDESVEDFRLQICLEQLEMLLKTLETFLHTARDAGVNLCSQVIPKSRQPKSSHSLNLPSPKTSPSSSPKSSQRQSMSEQSFQNSSVSRESISWSSKSLPRTPSPPKSSHRHRPTSSKKSIQDISQSRKSQLSLSPQPSPPTPPKTPPLLPSIRIAVPDILPPMESEPSHCTPPSLLTPSSSSLSKLLPPDLKSKRMSLIEVVDEARRAEWCEDSSTSSGRAELQSSCVQLPSVAEERSDGSSIDGPPNCPSHSSDPKPSGLTVHSDESTTTLESITTSSSSLPSNAKPSGLTVHSDESTTTLDSTKTSSSSLSSSKNSRIIRRIIKFKPSVPFKSKSKTSLLNLSGSGPSSGLENSLRPEQTSSSEDELGGRHGGELAKLQFKSIEELLDLVTGKEMTLQSGLKDIFFSTFRWYLSPTALVEGLQKRFTQCSAAGMNPEQAKIWHQWQAKNSSTQLRVISLIMSWLKLYWIPELDNNALEPLRVFALDHLTTYPDELLVYRVLQALDDVHSGVVTRRLAVKDHWDLLNTGTLIIPPSPTGFKLFTHDGQPVVGQLSDFDTPNGRLEFARQLTTYFSDLYATVDADAFVWGHYHNVENESIETARLITELEKGLEQWIIASVITNKEFVEMKRIAIFWFRVLENCNEIGNFSAVRSIVNSQLQLDEAYKWLEHERRQRLNDLNQWASPAKQWRLLRARNSPCIHPISSVKENIDRCKNEVQRAPAYAIYGRYGLLARALADLDHAKLSYKFNKTPHVQEWIDTELKARHPVPKPANLAP